MKNKIFLFILLGLLLVGSVSADLTEGLVSYYSADIEMNTTDSLYLHNLTNVGATFNNDGKIGESLYVNGNSTGAGSYVYTSELGNLSTQTLCMWTKEKVSTGNKFIFGRKTPDVHFYCGIDNNHKLSGGGGDGKSWGPTTYAYLSDSSWQFICIVGSPTNFTIYQNGSTWKTINDSASSVLRGNDNPSYSFGRYMGYTKNAFNGYIDEIGIWNRTLNDTEISWLYNSGDGLSYSSFSDGESGIPFNSSSVSDNSSATTPKKYEFIKHSAYWQTNATLSTYIFSWNNSGSWENLSTTEFGANNWSNVTTNITAAKDSNIGWWVWANDSEGKVNYTSIQEYLVRNSLPTSSIGMFNETGIIYNGTPVKVNVSIGDLDGLDDIDMVIATIQNNISSLGTTNTTPLNYAYPVYNPIIGDDSQLAIEVSSIYEGGLIHQWVGMFDVATSKRFLVYHNSSNGVNFSSPVNITGFTTPGQGYGLQYVLKVNSTYYMFAENFTKSEATTEVEVFNSTDKINWVKACPNPITTGGYKKNPAVWYNESDGVWHGLFEQGSGTFTTWYWNSSSLCSGWTKYSNPFPNAGSCADIKKGDNGEFIVYWSDASAGSSKVQNSVARGFNLNNLSVMGKFVINTSAGVWTGTHVANPDVVIIDDDTFPYKYYIYFSGNDKYVGVAYDSANRTFEEAHFGTTTGYDENLTLSQVGSTNEWSGTFTNTSYIGLYNLTKIYVNDTDNGLNVSSYSTISFTTESDELNDTTPPTITQIQPANLTINTTSQVNFSANLTDDVGLTNSTLNILNTSDNTLIQSVVNYVSGEISVIQSWLVNLADGIYHWWISLFDDEGKENPFLVVNSSTICYQETANISTECGGLGTGVYSHNFSDNLLIDGIDGSNSGCPGEMPWDAETCFFYVNYTIPNNANNNSIWTTYDAIDGYFNHTLEGCSFTDVLQFRITSNLYGGKTEKCWSGTEWILVSNNDPDGAISEEKMYWNISTIISGNYTLTVDTTFPKINIIYPLNTTYPYRINYTNYTLIETNPNYCWFSNDSGVTNYSVQTAGLNFSKISQEGLNTWTIFCNDTGNNTNSSRISFTQDTTKPTIDFVSPTTTSTNHSQSNIYVNVTTSDLSNHSVLSNVGLKLWLRFNNETGENNTFALDYSGYGNNGTASNGSTYNESGKFGGSFSFDGSNDVITTTNDDSLNISEAITLSAWVKLDTFRPYRRILSKSTPTNAYPYTIYGILTDANTSSVARVRMEMASGGYQHIIKSSTGVQLNEWFLLTGTWNGTHTNLYLNGVLDNSTLFRSFSNGTLIEANNILNGKIDTNSVPVTIADSFYYGLTTLDGNVDDVLIYDRALSLNEIQAIYNATRLDHNITNLDDGNYNLTAYAQDTSGNVNSTSRWITLDPTPSTIKIIFPQNITYTTNLSNITYTIIEPNLGYCWYSINDGTTNSSLVTEGTNFSMVLLAGAFNTWKLWCNDTVGNLNSTSVSFTLDVLPGGGGAVDIGGGGGTWDTTPINLDHLNISWDDFYYNTSSYIYVMPLDKDDKLVNLTNLSISIITPVKYNKGTIQKLVDGRWRQSFTLITSDITEFEANVFATENTKQIEESVMIPISEKKPIKLTAKEWVQNASDYIKDNWLLVAIISFIFFLILIVFSILVLMMRKKQ